MVLELVTSRVTAAARAGQTVYTVPAGKTARLVDAAIRNSVDPATAVELTGQWTNASASPASTHNLFTALRMRAGETVSPFARDLTFSAGDTLLLRPGTGQIDAALTFDVGSDDYTTEGYELGSTADTNIAGDDQKAYRVAYLGVDNSGTDVETLNLHWYNNTDTSTYELHHRLPVIPGVVYYPMYGSFALGAGDRLRARGSGNDLTVTVTTTPVLGLRSYGADLNSSTYTTIASSTAGTSRIAYLGFCNKGTTDSTLHVQVTNADAGGAVVSPWDSLTVPPGITAYPLSGDMALNVGDSIQARGDQIVSAVTLEA